MHAAWLLEYGLLSKAASYCASLQSALGAISGNRVPPGLVVARTLTADLAQRIQEHAAVSLPPPPPSLFHAPRSNCAFAQMAPCQYSAGQCLRAMPAAGNTQRWTYAAVVHSSSQAFAGNSRKNTMALLRDVKPCMTLHAHSFIACQSVPLLRQWLKDNAGSSHTPTCMV